MRSRGWAAAREGCEAMRARILGGVVASVGAALLWLVPGPGLAGPEGSSLRVDYDPPRISLEAHEVSLIEVLSAIGAKAGFSVVQTRPSSTSVTISVADTPVEDVLRSLLRSESHTIVYRSGNGDSAPIEKIVLLGAPGQREPAEAAGTRQPLAALRGPDDERGPAPTVVSPIAKAVTPAASTVTTAADAGDRDIAVGDLLRTHALAGLPTPLGAAEQAPSPPSSSLEETLAATTRRAQQALSALIQGLDVATRSLQQQASDGNR